MEFLKELFNGGALTYDQLASAVKGKGYPCMRGAAMKTINVLVRDKIASAVGDIVYICGNSDYAVSFDFDAEWDAHDVKTARFVHDGSYIDVVFTGNQCAMPVIHKAYGIYVGVYAGDLRTTTPAHIPSAASILSADGTPEAPPDDVYAQLTELCNEAVSAATSVRDDADAGKFNGAPGKTPVAGTDYFTEADKQAIAAEAAKEVGFPAPTVSDNGKYLGCKNGAAKWMPVEASGGEEKWEYGGKIPLDLETPTAMYEFASCAEWKKVRIIRTRPAYVSTMKGRTFYGATNCIDENGYVGLKRLFYKDTAYAYQHIDMWFDNDCGLLASYCGSNHSGISSMAELSPYINKRVNENYPPTYEPKNVTKESNWMFYAEDPATAWDGNETYYWWGVRA